MKTQEIINFKMGKIYELVLEKLNAIEKIIHQNLTEKEAIEYFYAIDNTYYRIMPIYQESGGSDMKNKKFTVYAERDNGIITTIYTYDTKQAALESMRRFKNRYEHTNVKFVKIWIEETEGAAI